MPSIHPSFSILVWYLFSFIPGDKLKQNNPYFYYLHAVSNPKERYAIISSVQSLSRVWLFVTHEQYEQYSLINQD